MNWLYVVSKVSPLKPRWLRELWKTLFECDFHCFLLELCEWTCVCVRVSIFFETALSLRDVSFSNWFSYSLTGVFPIDVCGNSHGRNSRVRCKYQNTKKKQPHLIGYWKLHLNSTSRRYMISQWMSSFCTRHSVIDFMEIPKIVVCLNTPSFSFTQLSSINIKVNRISGF